MGTISNVSNEKLLNAISFGDFMEKKSVFTTARGFGEFEGQWGFPGGKIESGEIPQGAFKRNAGRT